MIWWLYNIIFPVVFALMLPHFFWRMLRRGGYGKNFSQRFGRYHPEVAVLIDQPDPPVWIQAVSVGELNVALSFMDEWRRREPQVRFILTTNTSTGYALATKKIQAPDVALYFPLDVPWVMPRVIRRLHPKILILVENEMWPNLIRYSRKQAVPVVMINGRISEHSFNGYRKIRFITRNLLPRISWFCVQSEPDRDRLLALGAPAAHIEITGSAKYDVPPLSKSAVERVHHILNKLAIAKECFILVGGSTWAGEEAILADIFKEIKAAHPDSILILVPRHAERREDVLKDIAARNLTVIQRSRLPDDAAPLQSPPDVLLVDTTGELRGFYAVADVIFVGKSLTQTGGQNPVEPAAAGKAIVVGPHLENFPAISEDFNAARAFMQVADADALKAAIFRLLDHADERQQLGQNAAALVTEKSGATRLMVQRCMEQIASKPQ